MKKFIVDWSLRLFGWLLCSVAIILGPLAKMFPGKKGKHRPWIDGLAANCWRAYSKYNATSWMRRMVGIYYNPAVSLHYLNILMTKKNAKTSQVWSARRVDELILSHDVRTDHDHHRRRVSALRRGETVTSAFGPVIVVDNIVHDGNHRVAAYKEVGIKWIEVVQWWSEP